MVKLNGKGGTKERGAGTECTYVGNLLIAVETIEFFQCNWEPESQQYFGHLLGPLWNYQGLDCNILCAVVAGDGGQSLQRW